MQGQLNGHQRKAITQYINDTLSKYQIFQKEKYELAKHYEDTIMGLKNELYVERQNGELKEKELNEMREINFILKKEVEIYSIIGGGGEGKDKERERERGGCGDGEREREKQKETDTLKINDMSSIIQPDQQRVREAQSEKNRLKKMLQQSQTYCQRLKDQNQQYQKQLAILTSYTSQKQQQNQQRTQLLQKELERLNSARNRRQDNQLIKTLQKEKKVLETNIQKCTKVVKESEEYYTQEIYLLQEQVDELMRFKREHEDSQRQLSSLQESLKSTLKSKVEVDKQNANLLNQLESLKKGIEEDLTEISMKRVEEKEQYQFSQRIIVETFEKKIEIMQEDFRQVEMEYKDKINFLIIKLEQGNHPVSDLKRQASSKVRFQGGSLKFEDVSVCESQSISYRIEDSFRFDSASIARSIKENLIKPFKKPEVGGKDAKETRERERDRDRDVTPVKNPKKALMERTNMM